MNNYLNEEIKRLKHKLVKAKASLDDPQLKELAKQEIAELK